MKTKCHIIIFLMFSSVALSSAKADTTDSPDSGSPSYFTGLNIFCSSIDDRTTSINGLGLNLLINTDESVNINGFNITLFANISTGNTNGINIGLIGLSEINSLNGIGIGGLGFIAHSGNGILINGSGEYLNGLNIGIACVHHTANGLIIGGIGNGYYNLNGISIAFDNFANDSGMINGINIAVFNIIGNQNGISVGGVNATSPESKIATRINGMAAGLFNKIDVRGLSLGLVNFGDSWLQVGLVNKGDSIVQIGLVNFDAEMGLHFPLIYIRM